LPLPTPTFTHTPKNHSTPHKNHLNRQELFLNSHEFTKSDLLRQFQGKNTLEIARLFAFEFVSRFGDEYGTQEEIIRKLLPAGRAATYAN
jgi:hypothetical protein